MTIKELARLAGVSKTTVSFVFNKPDRVSEETRNRVLEIAARTGYNPDPVARSLKTKKHHMIGFLLPELTPEGFRNPLLFQILQGLREGCLPHNLSLNVISPPPGKLLESLRCTAVDGVIIYGMINDPRLIEYLQKKRLPCVSFDGGIRMPIAAVTSDDRRGAQELMAFILRKGHRDILILSFRDIEDRGASFVQSAGYRRLSGYRDALEEQGLSIQSDSIHIHPCDECSEEGGYRAMTEWYSLSGKRPTAVVAMSDVIAMGVYRFCRDRGITIPGELSVCGFDGLPLGSLLQPRLTTVMQPAEEKGAAAVGLLMDEIENPGSVRSFRFQTELLKGASTAVISENSD